MIEEQGASNGDMGVPTSRWLPGERVATHAA